MCLCTEYGSSTRIGPPPAVRDAYIAVLLLCWLFQRAVVQVAITFTSSVRSGNLLSGFDETFETFRFWKF